MLEPREDRVISDAFDYSKISRAVRTMPMITIYDHPTDYPDSFVARVWDCNTPTHLIALADTLEAIRATIPPNMTCLPHMEGDDPCIVEVWL